MGFHAKLRCQSISSKELLIQSPVSQTMSKCPPIDPSLFHGLAPVANLGVLCCEGEDAADFLHNQLSQDIKGLGVHQARMALFCNAKGRMQASMWIYRQSETQLFLVLSKTLLPQTLKRLSMFVLRAKAKLSNVSEDFELWAALGLSATESATTLTASDNVDRGFCLNLFPALGQTRVLWAIRKAQPVSSDWQSLPKLPPERFELSDVLSGVATIDLASFEHFVPQMLNMESIGAVSFKKGCYPGQEVVARSQFRGTLKRRALIVVSDTELKAGQDLFDLNDAREPCAQVVQVACHEGVFWAIACFSMQSLKTEETDFTLSKASNHAKENEDTLGILWSQHLSSKPAGTPHEPLGLVPLPYALLDDI